MYFSAWPALHANGQAGLWRDPDLQLALEWRMQTEPNQHWASRIGPGFEKAMTFLDDSRITSDVEASKALQLAEQERELERSQAIAHEQQHRLKAQATVASKQRQIIWLVVGGLIVTSSLLAFSILKTLAAKKQIKTTESVAMVYAGKISELTQFISVATKLMDKNQSITREFSNLSQEPLWLSTLDADGIESEKTQLLPNESAYINGFINQIWLIRTLPLGALHKTGAFSKNDSTFVLQDIKLNDIEKTDTAK